MGFSLGASVVFFRKSYIDIDYSLSSDIFVEVRERFGFQIKDAFYDLIKSVT